MAQHVPAWKKLGLKLKYAKDVAEDAPINIIPSTLENLETHTANETPEKGTKRSRTEDIHDQDGSSKKRKKSKSAPLAQSTTSIAPTSNGLGIQLDGTSTSGPTVKTDDAIGSPQAPQQKTPRKKSVTFTPETKEEDGFSAGEYFKVWSAEQQQPHTPPRSSTEIVPETPPTPEPASKEPLASLEEKAKPKEKKTKQKKKVKPSTAPATAYLDYLTQFHTDKSKWKFNKAKQNDVLRNVWNLYRIPSSYNEALLAYIHGLQGVNARQRLGEAAQEILNTEPQTGLNDDEQQQQAEKRTRAEAVVKQLQSWSIPPPMAVKTQPAANGAAKHMKFTEELPAPAAKAPLPAKRKRKQRTDAASSSSDSSSESESESESEESSESTSESESEESSSSSESGDSDS